MTAFWPAISAEVAGRRFDLLAVLDAFADAHVEHDLVDPRHLHRILVAELLGQRLADHLVEMGPQARRNALLGLARLLRRGRPSPFWRRAPWRPPGLLGLAAASATDRPSGALGSDSRPLSPSCLRCQPSISTPERLAKRTLRPSPLPTT